MALRHTSFYRVLYRPPLVLGGEREPVLVTLVITFGLAISGLNLVSLIVAAAIGFGGITGWRLIAKVDPHMSSIYLRQLRYRAHYAPRSRPARTE
jgi:type IV secretory pathway TrbD component